MLVPTWLKTATPWNTVTSPIEANVEHQLVQNDVWKNITPGDIFNNLCFKARSSLAPEMIIGPLVQLQFQHRRQLEGENQFWQRRAVQNRTQMSKHQPTKVGLQSEDYSIYFLSKNNTGNRLYFLKVDRFLFCLS